MKRLFLVYDDKDFAEWIEEELAEYGRFVRTLESLDFFFPQWNASGSADVIIIPETVIKSQDSFLDLYESVKTESPETVFLLIYLREKDSFIEKLLAEANVCVSYDELDTGLLEERLRNRKADLTSRSTETVNRPIQETAPVAKQKSISKKKEESSSVVKHESIIPEKAEQTISPKRDEESAPAKRIDTIKPEEIATDLPCGEFKEPVKEQSHTDRKDEKPPAPVAQPKEQRIELEEESKAVKKRRTAEEQKVKLQLIKERIVIEEKIVTVHVPVHFNAMLVSIISLYPRAGATFVASNFARMLGENKVPVAVFEPVLQKIGSTYFELLHGETNAPKEWKSWAEQIQKIGYITTEKSWVSQGVNWIPSNVNPTLDWTEDQTMQLLLAAKKYPVAICDISSNYHEAQCKKIISISDEIWVVADGDPVQLNHHLHQIDALKNEFPGKQMKIIGNKWSHYINQREWKEAVLLPTLTRIPDLGNVVLKYAWDGKLVWDDEKLKNLLATPFKPMVRSVMAKELYGLMKKQYGFGAKLRGFFKQMKSLDDETKEKRSN